MAVSTSFVRAADIDKKRAITFESFADVCLYKSGSYKPPQGGLTSAQVARLIAEENTRRLIRLGNETLRYSPPSSWSLLFQSCTQLCRAMAQMAALMSLVLLLHRWLHGLSYLAVLILNAAVQYHLLVLSLLWLRLVLLPYVYKIGRLHRFAAQTRICAQENSEPSTWLSNNVPLLLLRLWVLLWKPAAQVFVGFNKRIILWELLNALAVNAGWKVEVRVAVAGVDFASGHWLDSSSVCYSWAASLATSATCRTLSTQRWWLEAFLAAFVSPLPELAIAKGILGNLAPVTRLIPSVWDVGHQTRPVELLESHVMLELRINCCISFWACGSCMG